MDITLELDFADNILYSDLPTKVVLGRAWQLYERGYVDGQRMSVSRSLFFAFLDIFKEGPHTIFKKMCDQLGADFNTIYAEYEKSTKGGNNDD